MIQIICFSRKRPMQLHGYLTSVFKHWSGEFSVSVLVKSDQHYKATYGALRREFPDVAFILEGDFRTDLDTLIGDAEFTCFGCDDVVYVAPVNATWIEAALASDPYVLGVSLRLGRNITRDMFGNPMPQPAFGKSITEWDYTRGAVDWGYPWEVLGTVYRTDLVRSVVAQIQPGSPSQLEERGSRLFGQTGSTTRTMLAYPTSRLVVPTVNIVQNEFPNGITGELKTPEYLLEQWQDGWRLDVDAYEGMAPESWRIGDLHMRRVAVAA